MNSKTEQVASAPVTALLGTKLGMTQLWDEAGRLIPITVVRVGTNVLTQVRTREKDGYSAIQLGSWRCEVQECHHSPCRDTSTRLAFSLGSATWLRFVPRRWRIREGPGTQR